MSIETKFKELLNLFTKVVDFKKYKEEVADDVESLQSDISTLSQNTDTKISTLDSKKSDKATTLSGYNITDAKIADGTITLGNMTISGISSITTSGSGDFVKSVSLSNGILTLTLGDPPIIWS